MIIGHQKQIEKLRSLINKKEVPHALLFTGPSSVGKKVVARWFLKAVNCLDYNKNPCDNCTSCNEINENTHCDILEISPIEEKIDMEQIEVLRERVSYKPLKANFKGIIIDNAHLMNFYAQNAALKTIEEPTSNTVIFLITEYPQLLFETIISRCLQLKFSFVPESEIQNSIKNKEAVNLSMGRPGKAVIYSKDEEEITKAKDNKEKTESIMKKSFAHQSSELKKMIKDEKGDSVNDFLNYFLYIKRASLIEKVRKGEDVTNDTEMIKKIEEAVYLKSKTNANLQLIIERALI